MWKANTEVLVTPLEDELVLMHPTSGEMFSLNASSRLIWTALPQTEDTLAELLATHYDLTLAQAGQDLRVLLQALQSRQLVSLT
ncbi:PqqD family protein [Deinococcus detaillensis]|uniref:PqqD family protein n=1 Tax=Deinococcus detaillensis TaxID=2592048 RepID=A0A553UGQ5_9DEIO|nr:PqqD family protein [Deinococcus detaillensis]TSA79388.1 PqqD family protein [Deinococcus detaillensis]